MYYACKDCRKKVYRDASTGDWKCDRCNKYFEESEPTYNLCVKISDPTGSMFVDFFADKAQAIFPELPV